MSFLRRALSLFFTSLLPQVCLLCEKESRSQICRACRVKIVRMPAYCRCCFQALPEPGRVCAKCLRQSPAVDAVTAVCLYNEGARKVVLTAKFAAHRGALAWMARRWPLVYRALGRGRDNRAACDVARAAASAWFQSTPFACRAIEPAYAIADTETDADKR